HNIDEVPVKTHGINRGVPLRGINSCQRVLQQPEQQARADNHVQRVQPGHAEIGGIIQLRVSIQVRVKRPGLIQKVALDLHLFSANIAALIWIVRAIKNIEGSSRNQVVVEFLGVFHVLDAKEHKSQNNR